MSNEKKRIWLISNIASSLYFFATILPRWSKIRKFCGPKKEARFWRYRGEKFLKKSKVSREMLLYIERERERFLWNCELRFLLVLSFFFFPSSVQGGRFTMVDVHLRSRQCLFIASFLHLRFPSKVDALVVSQNREPCLILVATLFR